ncbi:hypothetical protein GP486_004032 [Trichoglossum hirsutum]|uniref:WLM-domain-containing protein n=1 Tax=Trichoglossum hirsutum TaxID=265104 RepID=A0A9P8RPS5_9PEZI|nr:hypothetical protein GP486_004032 [Trichoglossum hirsutum]
MKTDTLISEYAHLKGFPREAEALKMLQKVASLVRPIMRQRGWRVGLLQEFYPPVAPDGQHLLGLNENAGERISIRLREPFDKTQFLPRETIVETMLHELTHNVHGPHDEKFHALLQQLRDEHEKLIRSGYTGEGFLSDGNVLGGKRIPLDEARRRARAAAERRRDLTKGSGQKLGGGPAKPGQDIRKVILDAIERRKIVNQGCGMGHKDTKAIGDQATANGFKTQAEEDEANDRAIVQAYAELLQEEEKQVWGDSYVLHESPADSFKNEKPPKVTSPAVSKQSQEVSPRMDRPISRLVGGSASSTKRPSDTKSGAREVAATKPAQSTWSCPICTLENPLEYLICDACATERPASISRDIPSATAVVDKGKRRARSGDGAGAPTKVAGWICHQCGTFMDAQWWTCSLCGTMKLSS